MNNSVLLHLMRELSQRYFGHDWANGLEFFLWREINGISLPRSQPLLSSSECAQLEIASRHENTWFMFDDDDQFVAVDLDDWEDIYEEEFGGGI